MAITFESLSLKGLRPAHLQQLLLYIEVAEQDDWYVGNKDMFKERHKEIKEWIAEAVRYAYSEGVKLPKGE